jgi:hypothetical protein
MTTQIMYKKLNDNKVSSYNNILCLTKNYVDQFKIKKWNPQFIL